MSIYIPQISTGSGGITQAQLTAQLSTKANISGNANFSATNATIGTLTLTNKPQKVGATSITAVNTNNQNYQASPLTLTITPTSSSSSVLISATFTLACGNYQIGAVATLTRQIGSGTIIDLATGSAVSTIVRPFVGTGLILGGGATSLYPCSITYLDSPNTTSAVTYRVYYAISGIAIAYFGYQSITGGTITGVSTSSMTALECI